MIYKDPVEIDGTMCRQVNVIAARKAFKNCHPVWFNACRMSINNPWTSPMRFRKISDDGQDSFTALRNTFEAHNCDAERGKYAHFFIEVDIDESEPNQHCPPKPIK